MERRVLSPVALLLLLVTGASNAAEDRLPLQPSVFVTAQRFEDFQRGTTLADTGGQLWRLTSGWRRTPPALLKWNGQTRSWKETPVQVAPRPAWGARSAPPWSNWAKPPIVVVPGRNGALLAVVTSDVYQLIPDQALFRFDTPRVARNTESIHKQGDQLAAEHGRYSWLEAWLYRDAKWSERTLLTDLLKAEQAYFIEDFTEQTTQSQFFDLQVVGHQLWWTDALDVHVLDSTGKTATHQPPRVAGQERRANLVLLADGTLWCVLGNVEVLKLVEGAIEAEPLPKAGYDQRKCDIRVAADGDVWIYGGLYGAVWSLRFRDGEWVPHPDVGRFVGVDPDAGMWFRPPREASYSEMGYRILKGGECHHLPVRGDFFRGMGTITPAGKDLLLASARERIVTIVRSDEEPGWAVRGVLGLRVASASPPVWLDGHGNLISTGWSAKLPDGKLP